MISQDAQRSTCTPVESLVPLEGNTELPTSFEITVLIEDITKDWFWLLWPPHIPQIVQFPLT